MPIDKDGLVLVVSLNSNQTNQRGYVLIDAFAPPPMDDKKPWAGPFLGGTHTISKLLFVASLSKVQILAHARTTLEAGLGHTNFLCVLCVIVVHRSLPEQRRAHGLY